MAVCFLGTRGYKKKLKKVQSTISTVSIFSFLTISHSQGSKLTFLVGSTGAPNFKKLGAPQLF